MLAHGRPSWCLPHEGLTDFAFVVLAPSSRPSAAYCTAGQVSHGFLLSPARTKVLSRPIHVPRRSSPPLPPALPITRLLPPPRPDIPPETSIGHHLEVSHEVHSLTRIVQPALGQLERCSGDRPSRSRGCSPRAWSSAPNRPCTSATSNSPNRVLPWLKKSRPVLL